MTTELVAGTSALRLMSIDAKCSEQLRAGMADRCSRLRRGAEERSKSAISAIGVRVVITQSPY